MFSKIMLAVLTAANLASERLGRLRVLPRISSRPSRRRPPARTYRIGTRCYKPNGAQERARRVCQFNALRRPVPVVGVGPMKGYTALARQFADGRVLVQMDDLNHSHAFGWHEYDGAHWEIHA